MTPKLNTAKKGLPAGRFLQCARRPDSSQAVTGGLNWYRNFDRNWELLAPFADLKVKVPALFVGGARDAVVTGPELEGEGPAVQMLPAFCEDLRGKVLIEGAGHWNQQEAPEETNAALLGFLSDLDG